MMVSSAATTFGVMGVCVHAYTPSVITRSCRSATTAVMDILNS